MLPPALKHEAAAIAYIIYKEHLLTKVMHYQSAEQENETKWASEALELGIEGESPKRVSPLIYSLSTVPATGYYLNSDHTEVSLLECPSSFGLAAGLPDLSSWNVTEGEKNEARNRARSVFFLSL